MDRREDLVERATDYVLEHGLVGLSLRPLAAALGTSDRMLLYHLGSKDELVVAVIRCSTHRALAQLQALPASPSAGRAVLDQWRLRSAPQQSRCERLYVEASTLGVFGEEPYASAVAATNARWLAAVRDHLAASGVPEDHLEGVAGLVDAAFMGFALDAPLAPGAQPTGLAALAEAVEALAAVRHG
ncbi:TetR/AcrR family transcriptional regulator [Phycicoccus endophyticus]|uniref:TetR/AcrR family transcriptional regulator n=1 Tax=Phycicoccus endophyticus TaxID=1690220 RepID=A0A7G9R598_9MICO|nr:TetR/AcrR family transcriptional regulator [Phycicoccus endophyticus]NHI20614.1 TetR/AcrR family transcriptional regulator [Phycicoccus endophyticus]QNN50773.1 TetR/AcrR family transcriptional regulator [Phycicoccus endophyticus]GGL43102.1 TetR family transcriptional regulator [Phycicoccus endophyticus]